jgi:hypothetical protein
VDICYPPNTDWSCRWTDQELAEQRADAVMGPKIETAEAFAWGLLASLTAYRIGTCPITVRPCAERCMPPSGTYQTAIARGGNTGALGTRLIGAFNPHISDGVWVNGCGCSAGGCSCTSLSTVILPGPVGSIVEVIQNGEVLPRSDYRVMNGNRLIRTDGQDWPGCQDMAKPGGLTYEPVVMQFTNATATFTREGDWVTVVVHEFGNAHQNFIGRSAPWLPAMGGNYSNSYGSQMVINPDGSLGGTIYNGSPDLSFAYKAAPDAAAPDMVGTLEVTYYRGAAPNRLTLAAAGVLANEYLLACDKDASCRLPWNLISMSRSGEQYEFDSTDLVGAVSNLPEVQALIQIYNPNRLKSPVIVASPDDYMVGMRTA